MISQVNVCTLSALEGWPDSGRYIHVQRCGDCLCSFSNQKSLWSYSGVLSLCDMTKAVESDVEPFILLFCYDSPTDSMRLSVNLYMLSNPALSR